MIGGKRKDKKCIGQRQEGREKENRKKKIKKGRNKRKESTRCVYNLLQQTTKRIKDRVRI